MLLLPLRLARPLCYSCLWHFINARFAPHSQTQVAVAIVEKDDRISNLERELIKKESLIKKQLQALVEERKKSSLYLKLKDDKDEHIEILVKEKNRLHDTLQVRRATRRETRCV